jgi:hypothetical protein
MNSKTLLIVALIGLAFLHFSKGNAGSNGPSLIQMRSALVNWINSGGDTPESKADFTNLVNKVMSANEVAVIYNVVIAKQPRNAFFESVAAKYNLFT